MTDHTSPPNPGNPARASDDRSFAVTWTTHQPDPSHWVAVGTVTVAGGDAPRGKLRLLVGAGASEAAAVGDLCRRLHNLEDSLSHSYPSVPRPPERDGLFG